MHRFLWFALWALLAGVGAYRLGTVIDPDGYRGGTVIDPDGVTKDGGTVGTNGGACIDPDGAPCPLPPLNILGGHGGH